MFNLEKRLLEAMRDLVLGFEPLLDGPDIKLMANCVGSCKGTCKSQCHTTCRSQCKGGCKSTCRGKCKGMRK